jgi:hypothetical protein
MEMVGNGWDGGGDYAGVETTQSENDGHGQEDKVEFGARGVLVFGFGGMLAGLIDAVEGFKGCCCRSVRGSSVVLCGRDGAGAERMLRRYSWS